MAAVDVPMLMKTQPKLRYPHIELDEEFMVLARNLHTSDTIVEWEELAHDFIKVKNHPHVDVMEIANSTVVLTKNKGGRFHSNAFAVIRMSRYRVGKTDISNPELVKGTTYQLINIVGSFGWDVIVSYTPERQQSYVFHNGERMTKMIKEGERNDIIPKALKMIDKTTIYEDIEEYLDELMMYGG